MANNYATYGKIIGHNLRISRLKKGLRQVDISSALKMSPRYYQKIEYGQSNLKLRTIVSLAEFQEIPCGNFLSKIEFLIEGEGKLQSIIEQKRKEFERFHLALQIRNSEGCVYYASSSRRI